MRKFILSTCFFIVPFLALYTFNIFIYSPRGAEGDLARMGYLYSNPSPSSLINSQYNLPKEYTLLSEINITSNKNNPDVMTIGDSFSEQETLGYKNFLANKGIAVVHVDRGISGGNPIQTLVALANSDLFDFIKPKYVVLQSIEREINARTTNIDFNARIENINFYNPKGSKPIPNNINESEVENPNHNLSFFSDATLKMPLNNFLYLFIDKPLSSNTYKVKSTSSNLFSNNPDNILFYKNDLRKLDTKNDSLKTLNSINILNKLNELLSKKCIELIVLVSPDKYDLYYPYIQNKSSYMKPTFFSTYEKTEKKYQNIDTYRVLSSKLVNEPDIYYYDDTHWSPKGAKIVAEEIFDRIKKR